MHHSPIQSSPLPTELPGPAPFYLVLSEGDPVVKHYPMSLTQEIKSGQIENISSILEINPAEGKCRDISEFVARATFYSIPRSSYPINRDLAAWLDQYLEISVHHEKQWRELTGAE